MNELVPLLLSAWVLGLLGGGHCLGMCGGLPILERGQKGVADKGVCATGNGIPLRGGDAVYCGCKIKGKGIAIHA